jgi:DNA-binding response OmpR family regulator
MNNNKKVVLVVDDSLVVLDELKPDCILLDIQLPDENGLQLLQLVRAKYEHILVFMMTNHATDQYRSICRQMGAAEFFDKSMEFDRIPEPLAVAS